VQRVVTAIAWGSYSVVDWATWPAYSWLVCTRDYLIPFICFRHMLHGDMLLLPLILVIMGNVPAVKQLTEMCVFILIFCFTMLYKMVLILYRHIFFNYDIEDISLRASSLNWWGCNLAGSCISMEKRWYNAIHIWYGNSLANDIIFCNRIWWLRNCFVVFVLRIIIIYLCSCPTSPMSERVMAS